MRLSSLAALALAGTLTTTLPAQVSKPAAVKAIAGCYALKAEPWSTPIGWDGFTLPAVFQLDTLFRSKGGMTAGDTTSWYFLRPNLSPPGINPGSTIWGFIAPDSIKIFWYRGRSGDQLLLGVHGDTLRGAVTAYGDAGNGGMPNPTAKVTGVRSVCPAVLK